MWVERIVDEGDLTPYIAGHDDRSLVSRVKALYEQQKRFWPQFRRGHEAMQKGHTRRVQIGSHWVLCQYNPARLASVSAQVDPHSTKNRSCFLCPENLYPQEKGMAYGKNYCILCNVSPIFDFHLIIIHREHIPQQIQGHFDAVLRLTRDLSPHFVLIYNGPRCGASVPEHLHFQALPGQYLPAESQIWAHHTLSPDEILTDDGDILVAAPTGFSRRFLVLKSKNSSLVSRWFHQALEALAEAGGSMGEPMINLVAAYREGQWRMILFPRSKHRPSWYYDRRGRQLLISPGAIDMAGVFVIPRKRDYHRVDAEILSGIYQEVTLGKDQFSRAIEWLTGKH